VLSGAQLSRRELDIAAHPGYKLLSGEGASECHASSALLEQIGEFWGFDHFAFCG
jgi:hypothetical protein